MSHTVSHKTSDDVIKEKRSLSTMPP